MEMCLMCVGHESCGCDCVSAGMDEEIWMKHNVEVCTRCGHELMPYDSED